MTGDKLNTETFSPYSLAGMKGIEGVGEANTEMFSPYGLAGMKGIRGINPGLLN